MPSAARPDNTLGSLDRGLIVLEIIARRGEVRVAELARELGTSRTTMFRVLETLRARGFAEHVAASHTYRLGPGARSLTAHATRSAITRLAESAMASLRNATGETVNLIGVQGGRLVYEAVLEGGYALRSLPRLGMTIGAHCSALGKAVLSESSAAGREILLGAEPYQRLTENTITVRSQLDLELELTRDRGYAMDEEESETGLTCVAAAISGADGRPAGAISVSGLSNRMHRLDLARLGQRVRLLCDEVQAALGA